MPGPTLRTALLLAIVSAIAGLLPVTLDDGVYSWLLSIGNPPSQSPAVLVVGIDDQTLSNLEFYRDDPAAPAWVRPLAQFPWPRQVYGLLMERALAAGATQVGLDLLLDQPSRFGADDDRQLQQVLARHPGRITLAAQYLEPDQFGQGLTLVEPLRRLRVSGTAIAYVNALPASNGQILDLPSHYRTRVVEPSGLRPLPALSTVIARRAGFRGSDAGRIAYQPPGQIPLLPAWDLLDPQRYAQVRASGLLRNRIVLIGPTARSFQDQHPTPVDAQMPGVLIHAQAISTLVSERVIRPWPEGSGRLLLTLGVLGATLALLLPLPRRRPLQTLLVTVSLGLTWLSLGWIGLHRFQLWLPLSAPLVGITLLGGSRSFGSVLAIQRERSRLRRSFSRYVSPAVVQQLLSQPERYDNQLRGETRTAAILFADIRDFTRLTREASQADRTQAFVAKLNRYLERMVAVIQAEQGTIDKFIGDAVMAEFGIPLSQGAAEDCAAAVRAAIAMQQALADLNRDWEAHGDTPLRIGIGIAWGEIIVGNLGSPQRMDYTVIGDAANIASRVEGLTKTLGAPILITASLRQHLGDRFRVRDLGPQPIRGYGEQTLFAVEL